MFILYCAWKPRKEADLSDFWAAVEINDHFTMKFLDKSFNVSLVMLPSVKLCKRHTVTHLVIVPSRTASFAIRDAIRDTWANQSNAAALRVGRVVVYFLVSIQQDEAIMRQIVNESVEYNDLIVTSIDENYYNLTLKVKHLSAHCGSGVFKS
ncbi:unnamed protein product [Gongylonema pulchrum]|uniref:Hexosyltransferase n=1 Tax=Gongylonema pulchrum TaxID=637853 RepID=A0A183EMX4_9BILA|nr:unnamed protein product [Gongylonema pulchrum]